MFFATRWLPPSITTPPLLRSMRPFHFYSTVFPFFSAATFVAADTKTIGNQDPQISYSEEWELVSQRVSCAYNQTVLIYGPPRFRLIPAPVVHCPTTARLPV